MNKLFIGKINLSKIDKTKLFKGKKGIYVDIAVWFSEEPDQYGNNLSIQQSTKKDEGRIYIGEAKFYTPKEELENNEGSGSANKEAIVNASKQDEFDDELSDLPFILTIPIALSFMMQFIF